MTGKETIGLAVFLLTLLGIAVGVVWYEYKYPCLRSARRTCYSTTCVFSSNGVCHSSVTTPYTCSECVERGARP